MATRPGTPTLLKVLLPVFLIIGVACAILLLGKPWENSADPGHDGHVEVTEGAVLPDFTAKKFGGGELQFSKLPHKVTMVNFWATWCEACLVEMPSIVKLRNSFKDRGFEVVGVNLDEDTSLIGPMLKKMGMEFPIVLDQEGTLGDLFDVHAIPLTVILDRDGTVLMSQRGEYDWNTTRIRNRMEEWLK